MADRRDYWWAAQLVVLKAMKMVESRADYWAGWRAAQMAAWRADWWAVGRVSRRVDLRAGRSVEHSVVLLVVSKVDPKVVWTAHLLVALKVALSAVNWAEMMV